MNHSNQCNKLRVLVYHNSLSPYRLPLFRALSQSPGYQFQFLFPTKVEENRQWKFPDELDANFNVLSARKIRSRHGTLYLWMGLQKIVEKYDLLVLNDHLNMPELALQTNAIFNRVPVIRWIATTRNSLEGMLRVKVKSKAFLNRVADSILVTGREAWDYAFETTNHKENIYVCNNVIDNAIYRRAREVPENKVLELKHKFGLKGIVISYCGRLISCKGLDLLLKAAERIASKLSFSILLIGDGPLREELENTFKVSNRHRMYITGYTDPADIPIYYSLCDVLVLPSFVDTWGMVVNEAMAAGVPVICSTGAGASRDLIRHGKSGMIFKKGDVDGLTAAMELLLSSKALRKSMVKEADKILEHFTIETARDQFIEAIDKTYPYAKGSR